jgi:TrmH family RNA methyltransferase
MKKHREKLGLFVVEGEKMVREAIQEWPHQLEMLVVMDEQDFQGIMSSQTRIASKRQMEQISHFHTPSSCLAVLRMPEPSAIKDSQGWKIALDGLQDPGNLGTIIRTADWFGVKDIVCSLDTVDCYNPKVVQSSMGSIFRLNIHYTNLAAWLTCPNQDIYAAMLNGEDYRNVQAKNGILVLGNESNGIRPDILSLVNHAISIPGKGKAESLNVSVAGGILMSHFCV